MKPDPFAIREADPTRDAESVLAVWRSSLGDPERAAGKYRWFYLDAPGGPATVLMLSTPEDASCVGVTGLGVRRMRCAGRAIEAGLLADFAVVAEHRSLLPAMMLQKAVRRLGLQRHAFIYGMPNPKAVPVLKRLGYAVLGRLVRRVRVVRHEDYLARRLPRVLARAAAPMLDAASGLVDRSRAGRGHARRWSEAPDERFDGLFASIAPAHRCIAVRDSAFLRWRFVEQPGSRCRFLLFERAADRSLSGYAVCERDGAVLYVRDFMAATDFLPKMMAGICVAARQSGASSVSVESGGGDAVARALVRAGFSPRSERPVYGVAGEGITGADLDAWFLTAADEDQ